MINAGKILGAGSLAMLLALTGCQMAGPGPGPGGPSVPPRAQTGFEGDWLSTDGVAMSRFSSGIFETLATDTGNKLAEGNYTQISPDTVSISVRSLIRQTTTQVNCAMVTQTQLNCTSSTGQQFSLVRRSGAVS